MVHQNYFGRAFAASIDTLVPAANVGGDDDSDPVENDASVFVDFNGDGKTDMLLIDNNKKGEIISTSLRRGINVSGSRDTEPANVITRITNGFGAVTEISYRPLTDSNVYTRMNDSASANYGNGAPVYDYIAPIYVVAEVSSSSPLYGNPSAKRHAEYHYVGAKIQGGGRGLLGFAETVVYDPQLRIRTNTRYRQDFPFIGLPVDITKTSPNVGAALAPISDVLSSLPTSWPDVAPGTRPPPNLRGTLLSYSVNHWRETASIPRARHVFVEATLVRNYTLSGNLAGKVSTQNHYDNYGNLEKSVVSTYANDVDAYFAKQTTVNQWTGVALSSWNLGQLSHTAVTHSRTGKSSVVRESAYEHDPATGLVTREIIEPGDADLGITKTFAYDLFGNRRSTAVAGSGMTARTSSVTYDALGRFAVRKANALGQVERKVNTGQWDVFGNPLEVENIDGVTTIYAVDLMGRTFASYTQDGSWQKDLYFAGAGSDCPSETAWNSVRTTGGGGSTRTCFDIVGRHIRSVSKNINNQLVYVDQYYDYLRATHPGIRTLFQT